MKIKESVRVFMKIIKKNGYHKRKTLIGRDNQWIGLVFSLPFIIGFVLIFQKMLFSSIQFAFSEMHLGQNGYSLTFVGMSNFYYALRVDANFIKLAWGSIKDILTSLPIIIVFSLFVAVILNKAIPGRTVFRAIFFLPVILSTGLISKLDSGNFVMTAMSSATLNTGMDASQGALSAINDVSVFLQNMEFSPSFVSFVSSMAMNVTGVINQSGVQILISLAALQSISPSITEAANVEGATGWEMFWKITLPMVSPLMMVNVFYTIVAQLSVDTGTLSQYIRSLAFSQGQYGWSAAMSWLYFISVAFVLFIIVTFISRIVYLPQHD